MFKRRLLSSGREKASIFYFNWLRQREVDFFNIIYIGQCPVLNFHFHMSNIVIHPVRISVANS